MQIITKIIVRQNNTERKTCDNNTTADRNKLRDGDDVCAVYFQESI